MSRLAEEKHLGKYQRLAYVINVSRTWAWQCIKVECSPTFSVTLLIQSVGSRQSMEHIGNINGRDHRNISLPTACQMVSTAKFVFWGVVDRVKIIDRSTFYTHMNIYNVHVARYIMILGP